MGKKKQAEREGGGHKKGALELPTLIDGREEVLNYVLRLNHILRGTAWDDMADNVFDEVREAIAANTKESGTHNHFEAGSTAQVFNGEVKGEFNNK